MRWELGPFAKNEELGYKETLLCLFPRSPLLRPYLFLFRKNGVTNRDEP